MKRFAMLFALMFLLLAVPGFVAAADGVKAHVDKGIAYCETGHYDQALKEFNQALKLKPNDPALYDLRGVALRGQGQDDQALQNFNQALQLDSKYARAYRNRAMIYYDQTDYAKAQADLEQAQSLGYKVDEDFFKLVKRKAAEKK
jgi:Flp pilus assembly protein TadD